MKFAISFFLGLIAFASLARAETPAAIYDLEKKISYQQGQFGALYARCGSTDEKVVIGGTLSEWRMETFRGYHGSANEQAGLEKIFDEAANAVALDSSSCRDWVKQASATWRGIAQLSQHGMPLAANQ
jgi:hypothetical protein